MKAVFILVLFLVFTSPGFGQAGPSLPARPDSAKKIWEVEAACGQCQFGMPGKSCDLAIRMNGKSYFVDGTHIDAHGDAHAKDGFCEMIRKARVQGEVTGDRFRVSWFQLVPKPKKIESAKAAADTGYRVI